MSWHNDLVTSHRDWKLQVVETSGWITRSAGLWAYGLPKAHLLHQFVIAYGVPDMNAVNMLMNGYDTGTYFLYPPVANQYLGQTGIVYMIGGGLAQHAGGGVRRVFDNALADRPPLGDGQNAPGPDDWSGGSSCYLGTESHHPGDGSTLRQYAQAVAMQASLCQVFGWSVNRCLEHSNHTQRKTVDLISIDGNQMRRDIQTALNSGGGVVPPHPPTTYVAWLLHWSA